MADRDGSVGVHEEEGQGLADDVAAAENNGIRAFHRNIAAPENLHAARRSTGNQPGTPAGEAAEVDRMEAVHVFRGIDGFEDAFGVHLRRKRQLHEDTVHVIVVIQVVHNSKKLPRGGAFRGCKEAAREAKLFASGDLAFHVELRGGVFADEDGSEARPNARSGKQANFVFQFGKDFVADFESIENACRHRALAFVQRNRIITHGKKHTL